MHLVLMTSVIRPVNDHTILPTTVRIAQTIKTVTSIRECIPNSYIVMIEGGDITETEKSLFLVDHVVQIDVKKLKKSPGEALLLYRYLTSSHFSSLSNVETVSKISGRYWLNDAFDWKALPGNKFIISRLAVGWMGVPLYKTRYYRIPGNRIQYFIAGLLRYILSPNWTNAWPDIEHCFDKCAIVPLDEVYCPAKLGVCGIITGTGEFVED